MQRRACAVVLCTKEEEDFEEEISGFNVRAETACIQDKMDEKEDEQREADAVNRACHTGTGHLRVTEQQRQVTIANALVR